MVTTLCIMTADRVWELMGRKLSNEASAEELQELDHLLRTHSDLHFSVQTITDLWQQSSTTPSEEELQSAYEQHLARMQQKGIAFDRGHQEPVTEPEWMIRSSGKRRFRLVKMYASVLALLLVVSAVGYYMYAPLKPVRFASLDKSSSSGNEIATEYGMRTTQQLPDGSRVWLNAGSKLVLHETFGQALREVTLTGEAFFDVVKNPEKPFVIHTSTIDVKVLGTQFNVKSYPTDKTTETSLIRGSVEVVVKKRPNEKYVLKPNEKLVVLNNAPEPADVAGNHPLYPARQPKDNIIAIKNLTYQKGDTADVESAWVRNKLSVKDEPFTEVAKIMERWYDVSFEFRSKKVENMYITGSFDNETLSQALEALKFSFAFNYEINDKTVIVY